jgi:hypothetical protein
MVAFIEVLPVQSFTMRLPPVSILGVSLILKSYPLKLQPVVAAQEKSIAWFGDK